MSDCGCRIADVGLRMSDYGLRIADCGTSKTLLTLKVFNHGGTENTKKH